MQNELDLAGPVESLAINAPALRMYQERRKAWVDGGGELFSLPQIEQAQMMRMLASVGDDVSKAKPALREAYQVVTEAATRTRQAASQ